MNIKKKFRLYPVSPDVRLSKSNSRMNDDVGKFCIYLPAKDSFLRTKNPALKNRLKKLKKGYLRGFNIYPVINFLSEGLFSENFCAVCS